MKLFFIVLPYLWIIGLYLYLGYMRMKKPSVVGMAIIADKDGKILAEVRLSSRAFASYITIFRKKKELSRDELSKKVGIKKSELVAMEYGYKFSGESLRRMCEYIGVNNQHTVMWAIMKTGASFESAANYTMEVKYPNPSFDGFIFREIPIVLFVITLME